MTARVGLLVRWRTRVRGSGGPSRPRSRGASRWRRCFPGDVAEGFAVIVLAGPMPAPMSMITRGVRREVVVDSGGDAASSGVGVGAYDHVAVGDCSSRSRRHAELDHGSLRVVDSDDDERLRDALRALRVGMNDSVCEQQRRRVAAQAEDRLRRGLGLTGEARWGAVAPRLVLGRRYPPQGSRLGDGATGRGSAGPGWRPSPSESRTPSRPFRIGWLRLDCLGGGGRQGQS